MDFNQILVKAYEIGLELLKQKLSFSADELSDSYSTRYGSKIPFREHGFDSLDVLLENSELFERCPLTNDFRCVTKENNKPQCELPPPKGLYDFDSDAEGMKLHVKEEVDEEKNSDEMEKEIFEEPSEIQSEMSRDVDEMEFEGIQDKTDEQAENSTDELDSSSESLDSDEEIRALQISLRERKKRPRISDPGPSRFPLEDGPPRSMSFCIPPMRMFPDSELRESVENPASPSSVHSAANSSVQSVINRIAFSIDHFPQGSEVKLDDLFPVFQDLYQRTLTQMMEEVFGQGDAFEQLACVDQNKFTLMRNDEGNWIFHRIVQQRKRNKSHKERKEKKRRKMLKKAADLSINKITRCLDRFPKGSKVKLDDFFRVFEKLYKTKITTMEEVFGSGDDFEQLAKLRKKKFALKRDAEGNWIISKKQKKNLSHPERRDRKKKKLQEQFESAENSALDAAEFSDSLVDSRLAEMADRISCCLDKCKGDEVHIDRVHCAFKEIYHEKLSDMAKRLFGFLDVTLEKLVMFDQKKFNMRKNWKGSWLFRKIGGMKNEKKKREQETTEIDPVRSIVDRIAICLRHYNGWVKLEDMCSTFGQVRGRELYELCTEVFGPDDTYVRLAEAGQKQFEMRHYDGQWYIKELDWHHDPTRMAQPSRAMASPFLPRPEFIARPPLPPSLPLFMSDPRLADFAYRIRSLLVDMGGRGFLPAIEEAYFNVFRSGLQDDFFYLVPSDTPPFILTEISHGEIVVYQTPEGWIHFSLKSDY